jgi:hypothetical protein
MTIIDIFCVKLNVWQKIVGADRSAEVHTQENWGTINVSAMWHDIRAGTTSAKLVRCRLKGNSLSAVGNQDLDEETIRLMTDTRQQVPIVAIRTPDGQSLVVDGNHRLARFTRAGGVYFFAYVFLEADTDKYRVEIFYGPTQLGPWKNITPVQILKTLVGKYAKRDEDGNIVGIERSPQ